MNTQTQRQGEPIVGHLSSARTERNRADGYSNIPVGQQLEDVLVHGAGSVHGLPARWIVRGWVLSICLLFLLLSATLLGLGSGVDAGSLSPESSLLPAATTNSSAPACGPGFSQVTSPNVGSIANYLFGLAVVSSNNIWTVGFTLDNSGPG